MKMNSPDFLLKLAGVILLLCAIEAGATENPHIVTAINKASNCVSCHLSAPQYVFGETLETKNKQVDISLFKSDGVVMCTTCHNAADGHKVGLKLDFEIPADLPLDRENALSCLTCHYTHGKLLSDRPQASFSFMDRILDSDRLQKSYLLRRSNVDGELCLICHSHQGSK